MAKTKAAVPSGKLEEQQLRFCQEFIVDLNGTQAAIRAGYSKATAAQQASRLLSYVKVQDKIAELKAERARRTFVSADRVVLEYARVAFSNMRSFAEWDGARIVVKDSTQLEEDDSACIREIAETINEQGSAVKLKLHDKIAALAALAKHTGVGQGLEELDAFQGKTDSEKIEMLEKALEFLRGKKKALPGG